MRFASVQFLCGVTLLLLCAALSALWVRTLTVEDVLRLRTPDRYFYFNSRLGGVQFGTFPSREFDPQEASEFQSFPLDFFNRIWQDHVNSAVHCMNFAGFWYLRGVPWIPSYWTICVPIWFLLLLTGPPGYVMLRRWRTSILRQAKHLCPNCGYDLRATPQRCPECGTAA